MQRVSLLVPPGFDPVCLAPLSVFNAANEVLGEQRFVVDVASELGGPVPSVYGVVLSTQRFIPPFSDILFLAAAPVGETTTRATLALLRTAATSISLIAAIDGAALMLADAGLLANRRAAIHWSHAAELIRRSPSTQLEVDQLFAEDGPVWTSSSPMAGVDIAFCLLARECCPQLAQEISRRMGRPQRPSRAFSQDGGMQSATPKSDRIERAMAFARNNLQTDLPVERLAAVACLSPRQFTRVFRAEMGRSPASAIEQLRIEAARQLLARRNFPVELVAKETGFGGRERMRRAFMRSFGKSPRAVRDEVLP